MNENTIDVKNDIPPAYDMWKMFHSTITALFKNLDNAENNLQSLANTILNSKEFSDIFIPRYDSYLSLEQTKCIEKRYQCFTSWLLSRLFYLLSCQKFEKIHKLFIDAQLKILIVLRVNQPHVYNIMLEEYNTGFTIVNNFIQNVYHKIDDQIDITFIKIFQVDDNISKEINLDLSPIFVKINSSMTAYILQEKLLSMLVQTCLNYIESFWMLQPTKSILKNIEYCLENSKLNTKIIAIDYFTNFIRHNYFQLNNSVYLSKHYYTIFGYIEKIIVRNHWIYDESNLNFEIALSKLFDTVSEYNVITDDYTREKCLQMCEVIISEKLNHSNEELILKSNLRLYKKILQYNGQLCPNIKLFVTHLKTTTNCNDTQIIIEYQIVEELKLHLKEHDKIIHVLNNSATWKLIYEMICFHLEAHSEDRASILVVFKTLTFLQNAMYIAQRVYFIIRQWYFKEYFVNANTLQIIFCPFQEILFKLRKLIEIYKINTSEETESCLDTIIKCFASMTVICPVSDKKFQEFRNMVEMICYPFSNLKELSLMVKFLIDDQFNADKCIEKQLKCIEILSVCLVNIEAYNQKYLNVITNWIINIFKYCTISNNLRIQKQVSLNLLYLISTLRNSHNVKIELLKKLFLMKNEDILINLSKLAGNIICVLSGNFTIQPVLEDNGITYDILCLQCDFMKHDDISNSNEKKLYCVSHKKYYYNPQFIIEQNLVNNEIFTIIINFLNCSNNDIKINIIKHLPRFTKHVSEFNTIPVTKKWLKFIEDDNKKVRQTFIDVIKSIVSNCYNNESLMQQNKENMLDTCLQAVINATEKHLRSGNIEYIETLLNAIKEFGCLQYPEVLRKTSKLLIFYLILCNTYLSLTAMDHLQHIAKSHNVTPNFIFTKYKKNFCQTIANLSVFAYCRMEYNVVQSLDRIALAFEYGMKEFITRNCHHLLPYFIPMFVRVPESLKILNDIANLIATQPQDLLTTNFSYIYSYVYLNENTEIFNKSMELIERITKANINDLKKRCIKVIHNELLMHIHDKRELVIKELYKLSQEDFQSISQNSKSSKLSRSDSNSNCDIIEQIADYIRPRFLGVLVYFDSKLISNAVDDSIKIRILESLPEIMKLMGTKYLTPLRHKVLATLRTALSLTEKPYLELTCNNWDAFVHCCEVESLGPLLSTIFVSMLPLLDIFPRKINSIYKYLIIENNDKLKDFIEDLFFLTETKVDFELKNIVKITITKNQNKSFKENLIMYLKYINHENMEVRVYGLKALKKYLEGKHVELEEIILGNNGMDPILVNIIDILMAGCRENDAFVRLASGECIGELGAIEPSHFPRKYTQSETEFTFFITDDSFVINTLTEFVRFFQMEKHSQNMNRYALAIQEILKSYGVSPEENAPKRNLWSAFPDNVQEMMLPLLSSKYTVGNPCIDNITDHPIYGSQIGLTFNDWVYNWACQLIAFWKNEKRALLQVCKPSLKYDFRALMIFLPHILIHALLEGCDNERVIIYKEFMAVLGFSETNSNRKQSTYDYIKTKYYTSSTVINVDDRKKNDSVKVIFVLLDFLDRWLREYECVKCPKLSNPMSDSKYKLIYNFVAQFCKLKIAQCNFNRCEYPRALLFLEQYTARDKQKVKEHLGFFARIYTELEEPDGVAGAMALRETEPSLEDMILAHNVSGQLQDAAACYERMAQETTMQPEFLQDMVRCYLELDNPFTALNIASAAIEKYSEYKIMLYESQAEPFWRLNMYDELQDLLERNELKNNTSWGVKMGHVLIHYKKGDREKFREELDSLRNILIEKLSITSLEEGVYAHGYPHIIKLHILNEIQKAEEYIYKMKQNKDTSVCEQTINDLIEEWNLRLKIVQSSVRYVEPILQLRRIMLEQSTNLLDQQLENVKVTLDMHIGKYWLKSAEIARKTNIFQQAYIYILKAEQYKLKELFIEKAKLYWAKEEQELAFNTLKRGVEEHFHDCSKFKDVNASVRISDRKLCAEAKLLIATYNDETSNVDMDVNITNYREAVDIYREWEKSQVCLAQYYDRVFSTMTDTDKDLKGGDIQIHIINCFGKSLQYGSNYIYQSMPRMLSIWFDYGTRIVQSKSYDTNEAKESKKNTLLKMIKLMDTYLDRLPAYMFLSAFSQLVSRICHPVREVYVQIKSILIKLILKYPQQSMWMIMAVSKSAYAMRAKRCQEVLQDQRLKSSQILKLIHDFNRLAEKLIELCNKPISEGVHVASVNSMIRTLPRLLQSKEFSEIMLPIKKLLKLVLPNPEYTNSQYNPFPNTYIYIAGIEDEVQLLQSLQRPRKITFKGSDGKKYIHMLKPKDDLRKDCRLMEFNDVVNLYLHRESESRQRRLCIRTYSVVPLNEECGIVEWVDNLVGLRPILMKIYKQRGLYLGARELKSMMCNVHDPLVKKRQVFENQLLPRHPPVLSEWFRRTFPDPHCWYHARTAYVRTSAVVSMVGYVLGLGDRHGENILFDATNGDTVHVDFNCLFNKGETFDWPERVPFRLTHNMVDAMGPLGVEGIFRKTCATTLRVLRTHTDTLMSIVRPFVYDPLVSWPRNQLLKSDVSEAERTNEKAVEHIRNIELRLQGMIKTRGKSFSISLSCEGQANNLILEATSIDNLSQMYMGWGPFL